MSRFWLSVTILILALMAMPAQAAVTVSFHSFNGSLFGRYPHTFVVFDGSLDSTGEAVHSNYGFTATSVGPNVLLGETKAEIYVEKEKYIRKTNDHFTITVSDETYRRMMDEVEAWRHKTYDLETRNCIHFVGAIARIAGLTVDYPDKMLRKPRSWLNHISDLNPQLDATKF
ncbi:hypothetical protein D6851_12725 [Altericroceibacterium spongiae]|uniref:DUF4105 domain-containing protein n=2 Tax=Altericroceibacterium spongiae TaxID=2320269 RepID=A0A420EFJ5_9SPHN|nr:hypothetical protein D6851_12725 [Altericroceibacterium spongiae]